MATSSEDQAGGVPSAAELGRPVRILLVEDSDPDAELTRTALQRARVNNELHRVGDGEQALAYLRREQGYEDATRPDLILLDLNMPRMDGREVLHALKADPDLRRIPVVVLTTSSLERDVVDSYDQSVAGYVTKPVRFDEFVEAIRSLEGFWLTIVRLPPR